MSIGMSIGFYPPSRPAVGMLNSFKEEMKDAVLTQLIQ